MLFDWHVEDQDEKSLLVLDPILFNTMSCKPLIMICTEARISDNINFISIELYDNYCGSLGNTKADGVVVVYVFTKLPHTANISDMGEAVLIKVSLNLGNQKKMKISRYYL